LDYNGIKLCTYNGILRARINTGGLRTVLAGIAHHEPPRFTALFIKLLNEFNMAPVEAVQI
jgi:hypothetical protein